MKKKIVFGMFLLMSALFVGQNVQTAFSKTTIIIKAGTPYGIFGCWGQGVCEITIIDD